MSGGGRESMIRPVMVTKPDGTTYEYTPKRKDLSKPDLTHFNRDPGKRKKKPVNQEAHAASARAAMLNDGGESPVMVGPMRYERVKEAAEAVGVSETWLRHCLKVGITEINEQYVRRA